MSFLHEQTNRGKKPRLRWTKGGNGGDFVIGSSWSLSSVPGFGTGRDLKESGPFLDVSFCQARRNGPVEDTEKARALRASFLHRVALRIFLRFGKKDFYAESGDVVSCGLWVWRVG